LRWQTKLKISAFVFVVAAYLTGYVLVRSSQYAWSQKRSDDAPEPRADGASKIIFAPVNWLAKVTENTPVDIGQMANHYDKMKNPDGPAISEAELAQRFIQAHKEANIGKIKKLFFKSYIPDDDMRQISRFFDYAIGEQIQFTELPPGTIVHSQFESDLAVTRMMTVSYGTYNTMLPRGARYYVGKKDGRYFLVIRWSKG
jgi:hypothetical protein